MIRKILYFLLRRINFSPEKDGKKQQAEAQKRIFWWKKSTREAGGKKKTREIYVYTIKQ